MRILLKYALLMAVALVVSSCAEIAVKPTAQMALVRLDVGQYPEFSDDAPITSLKEAIERNFRYLNALKDDYLFHYGPDTYTAREIKDSLTHFIAVLDTAKGDTTMLNRLVREDFTLYAAAGGDGKGRVYYTGYYVPQLNGSRTKGGKYIYPLYGLPKDMVTVDLGLFKAQYKGDKIVGRLEGGRLVPYYTH
ncbi:MAG: MltA domain-containing protein, partial [Nitrospirae bacterium]|nr:MltA domain-containing protein [Nitrospirota bacterium]